MEIWYRIIQPLENDDDKLTAQVSHEVGRLSDVRHEMLTGEQCKPHHSGPALSSTLAHHFHSSTKQLSENLSFEIIINYVWFIIMVRSGHCRHVSVFSHFWFNLYFISIANENCYL